MKKTHAYINKPESLGLPILESSKIVVYEFWYDHVKPKYCEKAKLCYIDTGIFTVYIKTNDIYRYIAEDVETGFDTSNYELDHFLKKKIKK